MDVRPLHDRIIVRRLVEGEQKSGAIIIPDSAKEKPQRGEVIAAGNGKVKDDGKRVPLDVKAGDLILFGKYTSQEVKLDGEEYLIMRGRSTGRHRRRRDGRQDVTGPRRPLNALQQTLAAARTAGSRTRHTGDTQWQNKLCMAIPPGRPSFAGSTVWPTR
jgi:chaperonin GroES